MGQPRQARAQPAAADIVVVHARVYTVNAKQPWAEAIAIRGDKIVTLNPWEGIQNAVTRQTRDGNPPGGFVPKERISLEDAIRGYTLGAAMGGHREQSEGSLEPGKLADQIVISHDLFKIEPTKIGKTQVLLTMVGGKVAYESPGRNAATGHHATEAKQE
ncbi:MAG: amidohydrolase family protein [Terriglobales bacterium]